MAFSVAMLVQVTGSSAADQVVADVTAGSLWSVSMGTTSKAASYSDLVVVTATETRMAQLEDTAPEEVEILLIIKGVEAFSNRSDSAKFWSLLGIAEGL